MFYLQSKDRLNDVLGRIVVLGKRFSIIDLTGDTIHEQGNYNEKKNKKINKEKHIGVYSL